MRRQLNSMIFLIALGLALPSTLALTVSEAKAGPFDTLARSQKGGKRKHKRVRRKKKKKKKKKKTRKRRKKRVVKKRGRTVRRTKQRTTRRHRAHRRTRRHKKRRVRRRTVRRSGHSTRRTVRRTRHRHHRTRNRTSVHYHSSSRGASTSRRSEHRPPGRSTVEAYITGGLGLSGLAADAITDQPLPGAGYNLAVGAKGEWVGLELGVNGGGYTFDPEESFDDITMIGLSGDLKLQPSIAFFEPYALVGLGGYALNDAVIDEATTGAALRLGAGADFRFDNVAISARYLYSSFGFVDDTGAWGGDWGASSETLGANVIVYF